MNSPHQVELAVEWGAGHPMKAELSRILSKYEIPSVIGVQMDSILVDSIFGQHATKLPHRHHDIKSLSLEAPKIDASIRDDLWRKFEDLKQQLTFDNDIAAKGYLGKVEKSCPLFMPSFQGIDGKVGESVLTWFVSLSLCYVKTIQLFCLGY
jgi:hypothetical protein